MKPLFLALSLLTVPLLARANDSSFEGVAGSARPIKGENASIRMVSEKVILTAHARDFSTQADFVFRNETGKTLQVPMGFPEGNFGAAADDGPLKKTSFSSFKTYVDGKELVAKRVTLTQTQAGNSDFNTYWLKTVSFGPHQTRRVRVMVRAPYGGSTDWAMNNCLTYDFTGQSWRGNVSRSDLEVRIPLQGLWIVTMLGDDKPLNYELKTDAKSAVLKRSWTNWQAKSFVKIGLQRTLPFWFVDAERVQDEYNKPRFRAAKTVRIGAKPQSIERYDTVAPNGFTRDGVHYISLQQLQYRLSSLTDDVKMSYNASTRQARLISGVTELGFTVGSLKMSVKRAEKIQILPLKAAPLMVKGVGSSTLYIPLNEAARELGINAKVDEKARLLTISAND